MNVTKILIWLFVAITLGFNGYAWYVWPIKGADLWFIFIVCWTIQLGFALYLLLPVGAKFKYWLERELWKRKL